ncbi:MULTISPECIES: alpha/beta hydrolase [Rhodococcus]|uniref:Alpha/beta hydrolase n=2 Tax=Rhodococcus aetherivorans TaxID=191292 RepID=A0AA46NZ45_9NOCA|nr:MULTISPECIES: alpha/beta hydrolase [Rhodococcus]UYF94921.1 alpha/beta hydrolase [Rhodococcus aetherivorans]
MTADAAVTGHLHVERFGTGEPVLLLHGIGGNANSCAPLAAELAARGHATYRLDAAGYGRSADPVDVRHDHATDVLDVLDDIDPVRPVHLVGTSWGGVVALEVARRRPDRVRTLVLADSTRGSGTSPERAAAMRDRVRALREAGADRFAAERAPKLTAPGAPGAVRSRVAADMAAVRLAGYAAAAEAMATTDHGPILPTLTVPTLVLVGDHDVVTGVAESQLLADAIPGARLVVVADAGHAAIQEQPRTVACELVRFWEGAA